MFTIFIRQVVQYSMLAVGLAFYCSVYAGEKQAELYRFQPISGGYRCLEAIPNLSKKDEGHLVAVRDCKDDYPDTQYWTYEDNAQTITTRVFGERNCLGIVKFGSDVAKEVALQPCVEGDTRQQWIRRVQMPKFVKRYNGRSRFFAGGDSFQSKADPRRALKVEWGNDEVTAEAGLEQVTYENYSTFLWAVFAKSRE